MFSNISGQSDPRRSRRFRWPHCCALLSAIFLMTNDRAESSHIDFPNDPRDGNMLVVNASNSSGSGSIYISASDGQWYGDNWIFQLEAPVTFENEQGDSIARIERLVFFATTAPQISLNFLVVAGASDTSFQLLSEVLVFDPIPNAIGRASAGITVTDLNSDGVQLVGSHQGDTRAYQAVVNPLGLSSIFADLVDNVSLGPGSSVTSSGIFPLPVGSYSPLNQQNAMLGSVASMQSEFAFTLSAQDVAAGTSVFDLMVPEPCTALLLFLATSLLMRRQTQCRTCVAGALRDA